MKDQPPVNDQTIYRKPNLQTHRNNPPQWSTVNPIGLRRKNRSTCKATSLLPTINCVEEEEEKKKDDSTAPSQTDKFTN